MKALFIIHCQNPIYGASRSVGNLIRNLDADVDIIFTFKIKRDGITQEQIKDFYGPRVGKVWFLPQPARLSVMADHFPMVHHLKSCVKEILYLLALPVYRRIYAMGGYDFIHLNSATLYPMVSARWPMFIHVREAIRTRRFFWDRGFADKLGKAHGIIYISDEVREACAAEKTPGIVLLNPFDQTHVGEVDVQKARDRFRLTGKETVYAIIGNLSPVKGVDFAVRAFRQARLENAVLLVVGADNHHTNYEDVVRREAADDSRVRFLGEVPEIDQVYRVTDYVVRGDSVAGAGRTVLESLYSGGGALLMGSREENLASLRLPPEMEERVAFYPVRDQTGLTEAFEKTQHTRFETRRYLTNIPAYVERFTEFVQDNKG